MMLLGRVGEWIRDVYYTIMYVERLVLGSACARVRDVYERTMILSVRYDILRGWC